MFVGRAPPFDELFRKTYLEAFNIVILIVVTVLHYIAVA